MIKVAKYQGKFYQVIKFSKTVHFSTDQDWLLLVRPINTQTTYNLDMKWVRTSERFDWVRDFHF